MKRSTFGNIVLISIVGICVLFSSSIEFGEIKNDTENQKKITKINQLYDLSIITNEDYDYLIETIDEYSFKDLSNLDSLIWDNY